VTRAASSAHGPLQQSDPVFEGDVIVTEDESRVSLRFADGSRISLGEDSELAITRFLYDAAADTRGGTLTMTEGALRATVEKLVPDSIFEFQTNTTVASVRATDWMVEATAAETAVVTLRGAVAVRSTSPAIAGELVLEPGEGVTMPAGAPLPPKKRWAQPRIDKLIQRTALP